MGEMPYMALARSQLTKDSIFTFGKAIALSTPQKMESFYIPGRIGHYYDQQ